MTKHDRDQRWIAAFSIAAILFILAVSKIFATITVNHRPVMPYDISSYKIVVFDTSGAALSTTSGGAVSQGTVFSPNITIDETRNQVVSIHLRRGWDTLSYDFDYFSADSQLARVGRRVYWHYNQGIDSVILYTDSALLTANRIWGDTIRRGDSLIEAAADSLNDRVLFALPRVPGRVQSVIRVYSYLSDWSVHGEDIFTWPGLGSVVTGGTSSPWTEYYMDSLFSLVDSLIALGHHMGQGNDTVTLYAVDTSSAPDSLIPRAYFTIRTSTGETVLPSVQAGLDGKATIFVDSGDYTVHTSAPGYYFASHDLAVTANDDSVAISGYGSFLTNHAYIYGDAGIYNRYGLVYVSMPKNLNNSCDSTLAPRRAWTFQVGADGMFGGYVPYSSCFDDEPYNITLGFGGGRTMTVVVPDTSSYRIFWQ